MKAMRNEKLRMFAVGLISAIVHGCYNDGEVCQVGLAVVCEGAGGCNGMQVCTPEGVFSPCDCAEEGSSEEGGAPETSSGAATSGTAGGGMSDAESSSASEMSSEDSTTGGLGPGDSDCEKLCEDGEMCGAIDCGGKYHNCGGCQGEDVCVGNICAPPCGSRELFFVNAGVAVDPLEDDSDMYCKSQAMVYMEMAMDVVSDDPALTMSLSPGGHDSRLIPYGEALMLTVKCNRRTPFLLCGTYKWDFCEDDFVDACDGTVDLITIEPYDCSPPPVIGCDVPKNP